MQVKQVKRVKRVKRVRLGKKRADGGAMQKVGWLATGLTALGLLAAVGLVVGSLPELRRYVKMETM